MLTKLLMKLSLVVLCLLSQGVLGDMNSYLKRTGKKYLEKVIAENKNAKLLKSGMIVEVIHESEKSDAKSPKKGDVCEVTYSGTLKDGTKFDAGTTSFAPNQVIKVSFQLFRYGIYY